MERLVRNRLLVKDDVGKAKPCTVKLPKDGHSYGKPDNKDKEGAGKVTSSWKTAQPSKNYAVGKDFRKINKLNASLAADKLRGDNAFLQQRKPGAQQSKGPERIIS